MVMKITAKLKTRVLEHYKKARLAEERSDLKKALLEINKSLELFPSVKKNFKLLITKSDILKKLRRYKEAERIVRQAITVKPNHWAGWLLYGAINFKLKSYERAAYCYKKVVARKPDFNFYTILANAELTFDVKAALTDAKKALKLNPKWEEAIKIRDKAKKMLAAK